VDEELWGRVRGLAGMPLRTRGGRWFRVLEVGERALRARSAAAGRAVLITRRALAEAIPYVAAG
jgi:hypothetical protein